MIIELLHNLFGASNGTVGPPAAVAAVYAMSVGKMFEERGATPEEVADAYKYAFGTAYGWTQEETDAFWSDPKYNTWDNDLVHAYDAYVDWMRAHNAEQALRQNIDTMAGGR